MINKNDSPVSQADSNVAGLNDENTVYMEPAEIKAWSAYKEFPVLGKFAEPLVQRMKDVGHYVKGQAAGRRWAIGCVSLEVTQRCNLDCTLCYLSDVSEAVKDTPLWELLRRIDVVYRHYGPGTDIQISGGDPTLRPKADLIQIVKHIAHYGMQCSLFTNGILASRELLTDLAAAGLTDVAFHVDLTQERKGYATEESLNEVRLKYAERAKGLGLNIFFNTTVHAGNFKEIPQLVQFFIKNADKIDLASFQIQADTGRGVLRERDFFITQKTVMDQIDAGAGIKINYDMPIIGHPKCNKKAVLFEAGGKTFNMSDSKGFIEEMVSIAPYIDRSQPTKTSLAMLGSVLRRPSLWPRAAVYLKDLLVPMLPHIFRAKGKVNKVTFFIHNFMDACKLEKDRIDGCVFMVASSQGPISMCMYNAKRDDYILKPFKVATDTGDKVFEPLTGVYSDVDPNEVPALLPPMSASGVITAKTAKGRIKKQVMADKAAAKKETVTAGGSES